MRTEITVSGKTGWIRWICYRRSNTQLSDVERGTKKFSVYAGQKRKKQYLYDVIT